MAALFSRSVPACEVLAARLDLGELLGMDVDLVDLRRASPILGRQVLRDGRFPVRHLSCGVEVMALAALLPAMAAS